MTSTPQRPGGRSARVREAVLAATAAELSERGFAAMTIEDIATRSGVHKTTIYRRWSTLSQLVADAAVAPLAWPTNSNMSFVDSSSSQTTGVPRVESNVIGAAMRQAMASAWRSAMFLGSNSPITTER